MSFSLPYHLFTSFVHVLTPTLGGFAAGAAIVLVTAAVRLLLLPLTVHQVRAERARAALAPRVAELRARHADDPGAQARETFALYRSAGVGGGYLVGLVQAPVVFLLYGLFRSHPVGDLFGIPLAARFPAGGPVFWALLGVIVLVAWWSSYRLRAVAPRIVRLLSYSTVVAAFLVPLGTVVYLATTTAWTAVESTILRRGLP